MNTLSILRKALPRACLFVFALGVAALVGACAEKRDSKAEAAERARQMRDVSRMLDAMEDPAEPGDAMAKTPSAITAPSPPPQPPQPQQASANMPWMPWAAGAGVFALLAWATFAWRRRRKQKPVPDMPSRVSIAAQFEPTPPPAVTEDETIARTHAPPEWTYQRTAYEAPALQLTLEPVDLLSVRRADPPAPASSVGDSLIAQLHAPGAPARLYLSGDREHPAIRHVGRHADDFAAWEGILRATAPAPGADGDLARWLLPALLTQRAAILDRAEAARAGDEALALCHAALATCTTAERPWWRAQLLRTELGRISRQSGASRLLALRDLGGDGQDQEAPPLDAWIDIHLAWSRWLVGIAVRARLDLADAVCARLALHAPAHAERRRAEIVLYRARAEKGDAQLASLDEALTRLDTALGDPASLLLAAECEHQRATLLPPADAADACSLALGYAFSAGQHPAWHIASLELRLAIQATFERLPGHTASGDIAGALRRELADARSLLYPGTP